MNKPLIKTGFLISYDYDLLRTSLPLVYEHSDVIVLAIDKNRQTWTGNTFQIDQTFFDWILQFDTAGKVEFYEENFYLENLSPNECETRERNMLADYLGKEDGWHIQLDVDEYFINFESFTINLRRADISKSKITIFVNLYCLFKETNETYLVVGNRESLPVATNYPFYKNARVCTTKKTLKLDFDVIHQSWARSEKELMIKLKNWGHANQFDVESYFQFWKSVDKNNYKYLSNFHPLYPSLWSHLIQVNKTELNRVFILHKEVNNLSIKQVFKKLIPPILLDLRNLARKRWRR